MKTLRIAYPLILIFLIQFGCTGEKCNLNIDQAPALRGFRLGMTTAQVAERLGITPPPANDLGQATIIIDDIYSSDETKPDVGVMLLTSKHIPDFDGVENVQLELVDGRLARIEVAYTDDIRWKSSGEFAENTAKLLNLPGTWDDVGDSKYSDYKSLMCGSPPFIVHAGYKTQINHLDKGKVLFIELQDLMQSIEPTVRKVEKREEQEKQREVDEERRRREFKP